MDIKQSVEAILKEIEVKKTEALGLMENANKMLAESVKMKEEAKSAKLEADESIKKLAEYKKTQELVNDLTVTDADLTKRKVEAAEQHNKLVRWENSLVEIDTRQKAKEAELKDKEIKQAKREVEYKEVLKKEFFDEVSKKLS